jgi:PEP-CTERM motif
MRRYAVVATLLMTSAMWVAAAQADVIDVGASTNGGSTITTIASFPTGFGSFGPTSLGVFTLTGNALGSPTVPEPNLDSGTISVSSKAGGTLDVYFTELNLSVTAFSGFISSFTNQLMTKGVTSVTESTYTGVGDYDLANLLSTMTFTAEGSTADFAGTPAGLAPGYSVTEKYEIVFAKAGQANDTINLQSVPEPASLAVLGVGVWGLGMIRRRKASQGKVSSPC